RVATSEYSAENGRAAGAQVSVITQRGTRDFKGGGYYFTRNDRFDAVPFGLTSEEHLDLMDFRWNLGGPVTWSGFNADRSRLFFFAGQEWKQLENQVGLARINQAVPSLLERQGDFSQSPRAPTDPLTGQPFPGGIIPAARLSPNGVRLVNAFP